MRYQVELTARAERDLDQILGWFQEQQAAAAGGRWLTQLRGQISTLERHPERCAKADEASDLGIDLRELLFGKRNSQYRILFVFRKHAVSILHIRHSARDALSRDDLH